jgi:methionine-rich copper-binding protein CopC
VTITIGTSSAASAHANYMRSDPAPNAHLGASPTRVLVGFTEPFVPSTSGLTLLDAGGQQVAADARTTGDPTELALPVPALADGVYTVLWQTVSAADGDAAHGYFAFIVGAGASLSGPGESKSATLSNIGVTLAITPLVAGENRYSVTVSGTSTVSRVRLRVTPLDRDLGQSEIVLPLAGAAFADTGLELPIAGRYQVQVQVRRSDTLADLAYDFEFSVPRAASPTPTPTPTASGVVAVATPTAAPLPSDSPSVTLALAVMLVVFAGVIALVFARRRR